MRNLFRCVQSTIKCIRLQEKFDSNNHNLTIIETGDRQIAPEIKKEAGRKLRFLFVLLFLAGSSAVRAEHVVFIK